MLPVSLNNGAIADEVHSLVHKDTGRPRIGRHFLAGVHCCKELPDGWLRSELLWFVRLLKDNGSRLADLSLLATLDQSASRASTALDGVGPRRAQSTAAGCAAGGLDSQASLCATGATSIRRTKGSFQT